MRVGVRREVRAGTFVRLQRCRVCKQSPVKLRRSCGILLHPTSLPTGRIGEDAYRFVDWLQSAGVSWWQVLPLGPPDEHGSPYASTSAFACWPGMLADPDARVSRREAARSRRRNRAWTDDWLHFAGDGALEDQVRFEREWGALRDHARQRGVRLVGDVPIYPADGSCDHLSHPELFRDGVVAGAPPDDLGPRSEERRVGKGCRWR